MRKHTIVATVALFVWPSPGAARRSHPVQTAASLRRQRPGQLAPLWPWWPAARRPSRRDNEEGRLMPTLTEQTHRTDVGVSRLRRLGTGTRLAWLRFVRGVERWPGTADRLVNPRGR